MKKYKIIVISILLLTITTISSVFGKTVTGPLNIGGVIVPVNVKIKNLTQVFYAPPNGMVVVEAEATNNISNPYAYWGDSFTGIISLGSLQYVSGNTYRSIWTPSAENRGYGSRSFTTLKVEADGQDSYSYDTRSLYIAQKNKDYYDAIINK